jgi:Predicted metal-dependent phosphoesterases (PHP family)
MKLHLDCHVHTAYSSDSGLALERLVIACRRKGINGICVTDHNTIAGAMRLAKIAPFTVVVGEEIGTSEGEIIGYFLSAEIPRGLTPETTVAAIKSQGGLVAVPHPFDRMRRSALKTEALERIVDQVDIIEIFNSRNLFAEDNEAARRFAGLHGKAVSVGSDCHTAGEAGSSFVIMDEFGNPEEFLAKLRTGESHCQKSPLYVHGITKTRKWLRKVLPR